MNTHNEHMANIIQIAHFVEYYKISKSYHGRWEIKANVHFKTNRLDEDYFVDKVNYTASDPETLSFFFNEDPSIYPGEFKLHFQKFTFQDGKLIIEGFHNKYPTTMGNYKVEIVPV